MTSPAIVTAVILAGIAAALCLTLIIIAQRLP